jgi:hypothetical protein
MALWSANTRRGMQLVHERRQTTRIGCTESVRLVSLLFFTAFPPKQSFMLFCTIRHVWWRCATREYVGSVEGIVAPSNVFEGSIGDKNAIEVIWLMKVVVTCRKTFMQAPAAWCRPWWRASRCVFIHIIVIDAKITSWDQIIALMEHIYRGRADTANHRRDFNELDALSIHISTKIIVHRIRPY